MSLATAFRICALGSDTANNQTSELFAQILAQQHLNNEQRLRRDAGMIAHINTVAFQGIEALDVDVQVSISSGLPSFTIVGSPSVP